MGDRDKKQLKQNKDSQLYVKYAVFHLILMEMALSLLFCS